MKHPDTADAVIIGSGPNGLVAGITLARKGWDVTVLERSPVPGGAVQSAALTEPGFVHDPFSAFYGLLHSTPVFEMLGLADRLRWATFDKPVGAMLGPEQAAAIHRDPEGTAANLGVDGAAWLDLCRWWQDVGTRFFAATLAPLPSIRPGLRFARATGLRDGLPTARLLLSSIEDVARDRFHTDVARALVACGITHTDLGANATATTPAALILAMLAQFQNMPIPVGGAGALTDALVALLEEAGGTIICAEEATKVIIDRRRAVAVETANGLVARARHAVLADTGPAPLFLKMVGAEHLPPRFLEGLRSFRYGTGMFKVDLALDGPAPWINQDMRSTGVVHLCGDLGTMIRSAAEAHSGVLPATPLLIVGQQSLVDPSRAPEGKHTLWIETHVPPNPTGDGADLHRSMEGWADAKALFLDRVLDRIEEHAPGLRNGIIGSVVATPGELEAANPNLVGGDIGGGSSALHQQLVFRPVAGWFRHKTPIKGLFLCSASTHPGGGVHGMGGYNAAKRVLATARRPGSILRTAAGARRTPRR